MLITIDTAKDSREDIRMAIGLLANLIQLDFDEEVPEGTTVPKVLTAPNVATVAAIATNAAPVAANVSATPNTPVAGSASNVVNFPVPPPPPLVLSADTAAPNGSSLASVVAAAAASASSGAASVASQLAEYDSAGMPWDGRIHQKGKSKKKDGTWKLQKGIDTGIVQAVTAEIAARKIATPASPSAAVDQLANIPATPSSLAVPPPPPPPFDLTGPGKFGAVPPPPATVAPQVSLPDTVPMPPVPSAPPAAPVSTPDVPATGVVPVPPVATVGSVGVTYRILIDKMTAGSTLHRQTNGVQGFDAKKVLEIVSSCGSPNLQQLNQMPDIWNKVNEQLDLALAGLL